MCVADINYYRLAYLWVDPLGGDDRAALAAGTRRGDGDVVLEKGLDWKRQSPPGEPWPCGWPRSERRAGGRRDWPC